MADGVSMPAERLLVATVAGACAVSFCTLRAAPGASSDGAPATWWAGRAPAGQDGERASRRGPTLVQHVSRTPCVQRAGRRCSSRCCSARPPAAAAAATILCRPLPKQAEPRIADIDGLMPREAGALMRSKHTLQLLVQQVRTPAARPAVQVWGRCITPPLRALPNRPLRAHPLCARASWT